MKFATKNDENAFRFIATHVKRVNVIQFGQNVSRNALFNNAQEFITYYYKCFSQAQDANQKNHDKDETKENKKTKNDKTVTMTFKNFEEEHRNLLYKLIDQWINPF